MNSINNKIHSIYFNIIEIRDLYFGFNQTKHNITTNQIQILLVFQFCTMFNKLFHSKQRNIQAKHVKNTQKKRRITKDGCDKKDKKLYRMYDCIKRTKID